MKRILEARFEDTRYDRTRRLNCTRNGSCTFLRSIGSSIRNCWEGRCHMGSSGCSDSVAGIFRRSTYWRLSQSSWIILSLENVNSVQPKELDFSYTPDFPPCHANAVWEKLRDYSVLKRVGIRSVHDAKDICK